jgi:invasion protein IalB
MDAGRFVKLVGVPLGLVGVLVGCGIVWLLMSSTTPRDEMSEAAKDSAWPAVARYGGWEVQCRQNQVQRRKECRLEASWSRTGKVHFYPDDGAWNLATVPSATNASLKIDDNAPTDGNCAALCTFPREKSVVLSDQVARGRTLLAAAVTSSGQKTGGSISLSGFADALKQARSAALGKKAAR